jgi:signal peptidase II
VARRRSPFSRKSKDSFKWWILLAIFVVILDQTSKLITLQYIPELSSRPMTSFLNWVLVFNPGAAFSFLAHGGGWQKYFFIGLSSIAAFVMIWLLQRHSSQTIFCFSIALILGGAVGNLIDRFTHGAVVDFIDIYYQQFHWPAFNLADSAITVGTTLLILDELLRVLRARS